jgi:hypothetical protein
MQHCFAKTVPVRSISARTISPVHTRAKTINYIRFILGNIVSLQVRPLLGEDLSDLPVGWLPTEDQPQHVAFHLREKEQEEREAAAAAAAAEEEAAILAAQVQASASEKREREEEDGVDVDQSNHESKRAASQGPSRDVFVSNVAFEAGLKDVRELLKQCGVIVDVRMPKGTDNRLIRSDFSH